MECFISESKKIEFIGVCNAEPVPEIGITWDSGMPWDNNTFWI